MPLLDNIKLNLNIDNNQENIIKKGKTKFDTDADTNYLS